MVLDLINQLLGTVELSVESGFPERVLNICSAHDIAFWDMKWKSPTCFSVKLSRKNAARLRKLSKKLDCELCIEQQRGMPFFVRQFRKRYVLIAGLVFAVVLVLFGSFFIWDFRIEGNEKVSDEEIMRALEKEGITYGTFGLGIRPETLKNHMLLEIPELSWLTVNVSGFRATVVVREREAMPEIRDEHINANIVAEKDGLVTRVQLYGGHAQVMKGSTVTKGQLLISGIASFDETHGAYFTRGEGKIYARTWYDFVAKIPLSVTEKIYTERKKTKTVLIFGKQRIKIVPNSSISYENYDKIIRKHKLCLPGGISLPVWLEQTTFVEYECVERALLPEEAQARGEAALMERLEDAVQENAAVLKTEFTLQETRDGYEITLLAECEEEIGRTVAFAEG